MFGKGDTEYQRSRCCGQLRVQRAVYGFLSNENVSQCCIPESSESIIVYCLIMGEVVRIIAGMFSTDFLASKGQYLYKRRGKIDGDMTPRNTQ